MSRRTPAKGSDEDAESFELGAGSSVLERTQVERDARAEMEEDVFQYDHSLWQDSQDSAEVAFARP